ncbi:carbonic anhydrase [Rhodocollybia butyracea]|uniref:Carbonic anhydrase n=1 Tax=Rhodocollybia butyracea TaxID=206335 RepID=A0A9P5Q660_9AGAR|nr:carbonic anhydrase [Rhodocollybia butyracea]
MSHTAITQMLSANAQWAKDVERLETGFFAESAKGQSPHTLWIGCADSRVPESVITGAKPGDIFVNRNVGNQVRFDDDNMLAVLTYAVVHLGVKHVIVCGHTECGAAGAAFGACKSFVPGRTPVTIPSHPADSPLNRWLVPFTTLAAELQVSSLPQKEAIPLLVQENVKAQVNNLVHTEVIADAWASGKEVWVHGWVYDIGSGKIKDLGISQGPK